MLKVADLFDLTQTDHAELFEDIEFGWEALSMIEEYVEYALEHRSSGKATISPQASVSQQVIIGEGTVVEPGAVIQGPAIIGKNSLIRSAAYIRENVIVGDNCVIGHGTEVKNSLLFNAVEIPHLNYVGDSILGFGVHFGAGVITSNTKNLPGGIRVVTLEQTYETGLKKFGALVGDGAEVGVHAVLSPGTIIGRNAVIYPLALIRGVVSPNTIVKVKQTQEVVPRRGNE